MQDVDRLLRAEEVRLSSGGGTSSDVYAARGAGRADDDRAAGAVLLVRVMGDANSGDLGDVSDGRGWRFRRIGRKVTRTFEPLVVLHRSTHNSLCH